MNAIAAPIAITDAAYGSAWVLDYIESPLTHIGWAWHYDLINLDIRLLYVDELTFEWECCGEGWFVILELLGR